MAIKHCIDVQSLTLKPDITLVIAVGAVIDLKLLSSYLIKTLSCHIQNYINSENVHLIQKGLMGYMAFITL